MRHLSLLATFALAAFAAAPLAAQEPARPPASGAALEDLRAGGGTEAVPALNAAERATFAASAPASPALEALRATDMGFTDREVKIILYTAAAVVLLVILI